jgi:N-acetylneuraminic acid mutarotase
VLVAGGETTLHRSGAIGTDYLASAEIYDPVAGTWTPTGSMASARWQHTATLLPNGTVLVVGGGGAPWLASAEIYDPVAGTWTTTASMNYPRSNHTATLLANGTVLVAGGQYDDSNGNNLLPTVTEIYDPGTGVWTVTGAMMTGRVFHTATALPTGKVLVAGGFGALGSAEPSVVSSAEIYDPSARTWSSAASMLTARGTHTATLLSSGKVLVAGGCGCVAPVSNAEVYDPVLGIWIATSSMSTDRWNYIATLLLDGTVLVAGGTPNNGVFLSSAEIYH